MEDKNTQPLKNNKEEWICKVCKKPIELFGKNGFFSKCEHIHLGDDLDDVGIQLMGSLIEEEN